VHVFLRQQFRSVPIDLGSNFRVLKLKLSNFADGNDKLVEKAANWRVGRRCPPRRPCINPRKGVLGWSQRVIIGDGDIYPGRPIPTLGAASGRRILCGGLEDLPQVVRESGILMGGSFSK